MRILLTGATGYIAKRLLPVLLGNGHEVICKEKDLKELLSVEPISYEEAVREAFEKIWGRIYWYSVLPFHAFIFRGLIKHIAGN